MRAALNEAREKLAALPKWVKVVMWGQTMLCGIMFACLGGVLAVQQEQFIAFWNVAVTLLQRTPDSAVQAELRHAVEVGITGRAWLYGLFATISASVVAGLLLGTLTPMKAKKQ